MRRPVRQRAKGPIDPRLGARLRELRIARHLTQAQLAGTAFSKGFISLVETGRTRTSLRAAGILAERLGVTLSVLLAEDGPDERGLEASLRSALGRAEELERFAERTQVELRVALAAVRQATRRRPTRAVRANAARTP